MQSVTFTNNIPICPYCQVGTKRTRGMSISTALEWERYFDENGEIQATDPNTVETTWHCSACNKYYGVATRNGESEYYEVKQP